MHTSMELGVTKSSGHCLPKVKGIGLKLMLLLALGLSSMLPTRLPRLPLIVGILFTNIGMCIHTFLLLWAV